MKVKMIKSSNKAFSDLYGVEMELDIQADVYYTFYTFDLRNAKVLKRKEKISGIKNIKYNEISKGCKEISIITENSEYVFQYGERPESKSKEVSKVSTDKDDESDKNNSKLQMTQLVMEF